MNEENYNSADWPQDCCGGTDAASANCTSSAGGDVLSCLPMPASCRSLLRKLRAPGISLSYRMSKRMIPDVDAEKAAVAAQGGKAGSGCTCPDNGTDGTREGCACGDDCTCGDDCICTDTCGCGCQGGTMTSSGSITFRVFDAALVCTAMMLLCGVCCLCGKMKK